VITLEQIDKELFQSDAVTPVKNFVAAAVMVVDGGRAQHSGIVISYNSDYYLFHYTSEEVELKDVPKGEWYFHKELEFISEEEVLAFYAHCKIIKQHANPKFGAFYAGDYYNKEGKYFSESGLQEFMTCVGFCINVMTGYIENSNYFNYAEWTETTLGNPDQYFENFLRDVKKNNPDIAVDEALFRKHLRRITPLDYTSASYLQSIPISKAEVDKIKPDVQKVLIGKRAPNPLNN
jgi:hypothetical protein